MAKHVSVSRFSRLLQELETPVYVLDEKHVLIYFNDALVQWTNADADAILGQACRYHVSPSRLHHEITVASLAPPPEVLHGQRSQTILAVDAVQEIRHRRAEFFPLALGNGEFGTLVLVDAVDLSPEETSDFRLQASGRSDENPRLEVRSPKSEVCSVETAQARELHRVLFALRRHQAGRYRFETLIGNTPVMQQVRQQATLAAETIAPVLIIGPPGSGRETLANAIHYGRDGERSGGMIPVDCHALPGELIDSTIRAFYRRYARADKGRGARGEGRDVRDSKKYHTLLLNNADMLEPEQVELVVSVLENNPGNMRIIGTSPLEPSEWKNHPMLPWRLATIKINLPPLVERRDDILLLAQWFLEQQNARAGVQDAGLNKPLTHHPSPQRSGFAADALDLLTLYHWPGNIDELIQVVAESHANACAACAITQGALVRASDLPLRLHQVADAQTVSSVEEQIDLEDYLHSLEVELIGRAIKAARGNKAKAARLLGMTRPRLYRRLEQLGEEGFRLQVSGFGYLEEKLQEKVSGTNPEVRSPTPEAHSPDDMPDFRELES